MKESLPAVRVRRHPVRGTNDPAVIHAIVDEAYYCQVAVGRGDHEAADVSLRTAAGIATVSAMASHMWGRIYAVRAFDAVERDDPDAAIRAVQSAAGAAARYGDRPTCSALLNPVAAEAFAMRADPAGAALYARAAQRVARLFVSSAWQAMADNAPGSVAHARGDHAAAAKRYVTAADRYVRACQPYWADRSMRMASLESALGPAGART